eukprot:XP_011683296.1 PREDICTED: uncharacterized protein LOC582184 [Strongylocentrotus purpuratus]
MAHIPFYIPLLVVIITVYVSWCISGAGALRSGGVPLTCTSPCQQTDASRVSSSPLPPCVITPNCWNRDTVPVNQAPGGPLQVGMGSSSVVGPDAKVYLEMSPQWRASQDRISLLTGYEVKVMCNRNVCASQYFCVTVSFNRTLTIEDTRSNFTVSCQYGNFSQPSMDYVIIIRSLPKNNDDSNKASHIAALPSCKQKPLVSLCHIDSPQDWVPEYKPFISQISNGSVVVSFWPSTSKTYPRYHVLLEEVGVKERRMPNFFEAHFDSQRDGNPYVYFNNVPKGIYIALVCIDESVCRDCTYFKSSNNITALAMPTPTQSTTPTSPRTTTRPRDPEKVSNKSASPLLWAALAGALGGILGVILIIFLIARTRKRNSLPPSKKSGDEKEIGGDHLGRSPMLHRNNVPYDDCDSITGTGYINQWPPPWSSNSDYDNNLFGISNPSMIPPIIHNEWKQTNGRLAQESEFYANTIGYQRGDSISKVAVDVHSSMETQTSFKSGLPSMEPPDSGVDSIYSEGTMEDGQTLFSLALTNLGEEV